MHGSRKLNTDFGQVRVFTGQDIARLVRKCETATDKACLALDLTGTNVVRLTPRQATLLAKAGATYAATLRSLTPLEQAAVKDNRLLLSHIHNHSSRKLDDTALEQVIVNNGIDRAWRIIDKLTKPVGVAAE